MATVLAIAGAIFLNAALTLVLSGAKSSRELKLLARTALPQDGEHVAFAGTIKVSGAPLRSPFTNEECALYSYDITHEEEIRRHTGTGPDRQTKTITDFSGLALAAASLDTAVGRFRLLSFPLLEDFPDQVRGSREDLANARRFLDSTTFEKMGLISQRFGAIAQFDNALSGSEGSFRRDWEGAGRRNLDALKLSESYVPINAKLVAFGIYDAERRGIRSGREPLRVIAGDLETVRGQLAGRRRRRPLAAIIVATPVLAILALMFVAPARVLTTIRAGKLLDEQRQRVADALRANDVAMLRKLVPGIDVNEPIDGDVLPLMMARSVSAGRVLLDAGADPNGHRSQQRSVLMELAHTGPPDLLRLVIERGAKVNEVNPVWNYTALTFARDVGDPDVIETLIDAGATDQTFEENGGEILQDNSSPIAAIDKRLNETSRPGDPDRTWSHHGVMTKDSVKVDLETQDPDGTPLKRHLELARRNGRWVVTADDWKR